MWYLAVVPLFMVCLLSGWATALAALSLSDSYEPARVGERRSGWVDDHYPEFIIGIDHDQLLYADLADPVPDRLDCGVYSEGRRLDDPMRADRPLGVPETITSGGRTYQFVAVYRPRPNFFDVSSVRCSGSSTLLVKPSNRPQLLFYGGAVTVVMAQLVLCPVNSLTKV